MEVKTTTSPTARTFQISHEEMNKARSSRHLYTIARVFGCAPRPMVTSPCCDSAGRPHTPEPAGSGRYPEPSPSSTSSRLLVPTPELSCGLGEGGNIWLLFLNDPIRLLEIDAIRAVTSYEVMM